jgi:hypothetical protein
MGRGVASPETDRRQVRLNEEAVRALPRPPKGQRQYRFPGAIVQGRPVVKGFAVSVTAAGARSYVLNYSVKGRERRMVIGAADAWTVPKAAAEARRLRQMADQGVDPLAERDAVTGDRTVKAVALRYLDAERGRLRSIKLRERAFERWIFPKAGSLQIGDLRRSQVAAVLAHVRSHPDGGLPSHKASRRTSRLLRLGMPRPAARPTAMNPRRFAKWRKSTRASAPGNVS